MNKDDKNKKKEGSNKEIEELNKKAEEFDALKNLASQLENLYKKAVADYQNLERRTREERSIWIRTATKDLVIKLLPVLDDLYKANKHLKDEGLRLIIQKFFGILNKEGLTEIPPTKGSLFVPESMRSIATVDVDEEKDGRVTEETLTGYKLNGEVIRPAEVIVGKKGDAEIAFDAMK